MMVVFEIWGPSQHGFIEITTASSGRLKSSDWSADSAAKLLWSLARYGKGEEILKHRQVAVPGSSGLHTVSGKKWEKHGDFTRKH